MEPDMTFSELENLINELILDSSEQEKQFNIETNKETSMVPKTKELELKLEMITSAMNGTKLTQNDIENSIESINYYQAKIDKKLSILENKCPNFVVKSIKSSFINDNMYYLLEKINMELENLQKHTELLYNSINIEEDGLHSIMETVNQYVGCCFLIKNKISWIEDHLKQYHENLCLD